MISISTICMRYKMLIDDYRRALEHCKGSMSGDEMYEAFARFEAAKNYLEMLQEHEHDCKIIDIREGGKV